MRQANTLRYHTEWYRFIFEERLPRYIVRRIQPQYNLCLYCLMATSIDTIIQAPEVSGLMRIVLQSLLSAGHQTMGSPAPI
jgi:hypothetical protein